MLLKLIFITINCNALKRKMYENDEKCTETTSKDFKIR